MPLCPYCDQRFEAPTSAGRCPHCQSLLTWGAGAQGSGAATKLPGESGRQGASRPGDATLADSALEAMRANLRTLVNRQAKEVVATFVPAKVRPAGGSPTPADLDFSLNLSPTQTPANLPPQPTGSKRPTVPDARAGDATLELPPGGLPPEAMPSAEPPGSKRPTVSDIRTGDATLELPPGGLGPAYAAPPQSPSAQRPSSPTIEAPFDSHATPPAIEPSARSRPTLPNPGAGDATIEYQTLDFDSLPTSGHSDTDATIAGTWVHGSPGSPDGPARASSLSPDDSARLTTMWTASLGGDVSPRHTIKIETASGGAESSLVIRPRVLAQPGEPASRVTDYELLKLLGEGGMGVVYSARQASIDRSVAVKMLRGDLAADVDQREKFLAEAVITGDLDHPNIVPIYELGANESGALFYSMKRVQGVPWLRVIQEKSLSENLEILMKVADAIAFAHSRGVLHRDLKPDNVMLGDFGEVLVMDWGIAISTGESRLEGTIRQTSSMGGTPAYMAPEMATGPIDRIGPASDVYLLGAILYEIVTGSPPHTGRDVMSCLFNAATNTIVPTTVSGELVDIARVAMATDPTQRYESVREFQGAIRRYQSHQESVVLTHRAAADLEAAVRSGDYQDYARAKFALEEALALWPENTTAQTDLVGVRLRYAEQAFGKDDLDLAASLLDAELPLHQALYGQIEAAQREREARQKRLTMLRRTAAGLLAAVLLIGTLAYFGIRAQRDRAVAAEQDAKRQFVRAEQARGEAVTNAAVAERARETATEERNRAQRAEIQARSDRDAAVAARQSEADQRRAREYQAYIAQIGLAAAKIDENGFGEAAKILSETQPGLRHWEWGRLWHLCLQAQQTITAAGPIDALAISPDGQRLLTGSWQGLAHIWDLATGKPLVTVQQGVHVHGVAFSPDGSRFATASNDPEGEVRLWNAATGQLLQTYSGHTDSALAVAFSHDGRRLVSASYDNTARVWDVDTGSQLLLLSGHSYWVWSAEFSPDDRRIVTASQDGTVLIWSAESGTAGTPFRGHDGPVYCARFAPDGQTIASGGNDKQVLLWNPDQVRPFDYQALSTGQAPQGPTYRALTGHAASVRCVAFDESGQRLASGGHDNSVKLWNLADDSLTVTLRGHAGWVRACGFTPDGKRVVSAGHDQVAKVWDPAQYAEVRHLRGHTDGLLDGQFSPDGSQVVTVGRDRTARLWDLGTGRSLETLDEGHEFLVTSAQFWPEGNRILTAAGDDTTRLWNAETATELWRAEATGRVGIAALSPDALWVATGTGGTDLALWQASDGEPAGLLSGHRSQVTSISFSPDSARLISGDAKGHLRIWDRATAQELKRLEGHTESIVALAWLAGDRALSASADRTVAQWNLATGEELTDRVLRHPAGLTSLAVSHDAQWAVTTCGDDQVRVWHLADAKLERSYRVDDAKFASADFSPDGQWVVALGGAAGLHAWNFARGNEADPGPLSAPRLTPEQLGGANWLVRFDPAGNRLLTAGGSETQLWSWPDLQPAARLNRNGVLSGVVFSPTERRLATSSWDASLRIWDLDTGRAEAKLVSAGDAYINRLAISPEGRWLVAARDDHSLEVWDWQTRELVKRLAGHTGAVRDVVFFPDGRRLATGAADRTVRIWDLASGETLEILEGHAWGVTSVEVSRDGLRLASGSEDNTARIWTLDDSVPTLVLAGHTAAVTGVAFSPDGARLVTSSQDNTARLWDALTGQEVLTLSGHREELTGVRFSPSGREVLTISSDQTAIVWLSVDWRADVAPQHPTAVLIAPASTGR